MKWFYLLGLLLLGVSWAQAEEESVGLQAVDSSEESSEIDFKESLQNLFQKKCEQAGGKPLLEKLSKSIDHAKVCIEEHLPKNQEELKGLKESGSSEELCSDKRVKLRKCFADLIDALKECADDEEKYLPEFVFDALDAVLDYICADEGAIVLKILDDTTLECAFGLMEKENLTDPCDDKLKVLKDDTPEDLVITKDELCHDLSIAKTCYADFIKQECPEAKHLEEVITGLYGAVSTPCTKDATNPLNLKLPSTRRK